MAKSTTFDNDLLKLIFNNTPISGIADAAASAPVTTLYCSLHTADPSGGTQTTSEVTYGAYARVGVVRSTSGWTVTANSVSPVASISFPSGTSGSAVASYMAVGVASSGASKVLYSGALSPTITTGSGVVPIISSASTISET